MLGTTYWDWFTQHGDPSAERSFFGVIPAYPVFMFIGVAVTILLAVIRFKQKGVPLRELELAIFITVPPGVLGASLFGKMFIPNMVWYRTFFFWEPGMSLFGCLLLGMTAGFVWFYLRSKKTQISMWVYADCIIPNILIGQAIGRWGNLFNHEIMGQEVSYEQLSWLPEWIKNKLFYFPNLSEFHLTGDWWNHLESLPDGAKDILKKDIVYHQPLFLYESVANIFIWVLITFGVENIGRIFSKPKPWDLQPKGYPGWYNKQFKTLKETDLVDVQTQLPVKYKHVKVQTETGEEIEIKLGFYQAWNKAYYWYVPSEEATRKIENKEIEQQNTLEVGLKNLKKLKANHKLKMLKIKTDYKHKLNNQPTKSAKYADLVKVKQKTEREEDIQFSNKKQEIYNLIGDWTRVFKGKPTSRELELIHNPNQYLVIRSGVSTGCYIVGYLILRIVLETQRKLEELFIQNSLILDFMVLALILLAGIAIIIMAQWIAPYRYREVHWLYEKSY
ncbi:prolipoprotein diacylglyceryl transferase [Williamsoniiplasma lucivorax]|uniref:Prolipoprotein diacylglyceryl transferase n=1 Tax=Williamsoniiplasma lucivorax TaxID=209274 RepID=A0A2S5RET7_9MOLU|nr:prolipoprotein diacylglyceryl transferase family protein [Williamsoniiplasma lucivorax]PPE05820.1 prolipoprotein diacylglyceryl transferase [Williamsoniiplasma lucivorax]